MANNLTDYGENACLKWLLTTSVQTRPSIWYIGLGTAFAGDALTEISSSLYTRAVVSFIDPNNGRTANGSEVLFAVATSNYGGNITSFGVYDAVSGGNCLIAGDLTAAVTVGVGDQVRFASGAVVVSLA